MTVRADTDALSKLLNTLAGDTTRGVRTTPAHWSIQRQIIVSRAAAKISSNR